MINTYLESQEQLILQAMKSFINTPQGFKSLTHYMRHRRLIKRWCFLHGCRSMDNEAGKHFDKNRLRKMKRELRK